MTNSTEKKYSDAEIERQADRLEREGFYRAADMLRWLLLPERKRQADRLEREGFHRAADMLRQAELDGMMLVAKEDGNNYCLILTALGMEEEGDPVAEVKRLVEQSQAARGVVNDSDVERACRRVCEINGWDPDKRVSYAGTKKLARQPNGSFIPQWEMHEKNVRAALEAHEAGRTAVKICATCDGDGWVYAGAIPGDPDRTKPCPEFHERSDVRGEPKNILASYLDDGGWHNEAHNVRNGVDLESYESELELLDWVTRHCGRTSESASESTPVASSIGETKPVASTETPDAGDKTAPESARVPDGWRPIDSAPADGTPHVRGGMVHSAEGEELYWDACAGHIDTEDGRFLDAGGDDFGWDAEDFTHWHALAAAPKPEAEG